MSLPSPATRKKLHHRSVHCQGFQREDGLWDIEAQLTDTKTYSFANSARGEIPVGEPLHLMEVRLTMDLEMNIKAVHSAMLYTPFTICPGAQVSMQQLVGLKIGKGWLRQVRKLVGRHESCTHLIELLGPLSTTAYQTMHHAVQQSTEQADDKAQKRPEFIDQCYALASNSEVVKVEWPTFYTGPGKPKASAAEPGSGQ